MDQRVANRPSTFATTPESSQVTFLSIAIIVASVLAWFSSTIQNAFFDCYRAGLLPDGWAAKTGSAGAALAIFACAVAPTSVGVVQGIALATLGAALAIHGRVLMLAALHGLDSQLAEAYRQHYDLARRVRPLTEWTDPKALQVYLDKAYGKGRVSAVEMLARAKS